MANYDLAVEYYWDWIKGFLFIKHWVVIDPGTEMDKTVELSKYDFAGFNTLLLKI